MALVADQSIEWQVWRRKWDFHPDRECSAETMESLAALIMRPVVAVTMRWQVEAETGLTMAPGCCFSKSVVPGYYFAKLVAIYSAMRCSDDFLGLHRGKYKVRSLYD